MLGRFARLLLAALVVVETVVAVTEPSSLSRALSTAVAIVAALALGFSLGTSQALDVLSAVQASLAAAVLPIDVEVGLSRDDEGHVTALVTRPNGDPIVLRVPDEVAERGPAAVAPWLAEQLADADDE